jgi:hypothetical protein
VSKPFAPAVFITGAALTAVGAGLIVWSGIDTLNSPGRNTVRNACSGGPTAGDCQKEYQLGQNAQLRTNVIIAVTSGVAAATAVIGLFFTEWSPPAATARARAVGAKGHKVSLTVGIGGAGVEGSF